MDGIQNQGQERQEKGVRGSYQRQDCHICISRIRQQLGLAKVLKSRGYSFQKAKLCYEAIQPLINEKIPVCATHLSCFLEVCPFLRFSFQLLCPSHLILLHLSVLYYVQIHCLQAYFCTICMYVCFSVFPFFFPLPFGSRSPFHGLSSTICQSK